MQDRAVELTAEEQRRLQQLQAALELEDPSFARRMSSRSRAGVIVASLRTKLRPALGAPAAGAGLALVLVGLPIGFGVAFGGYLLMLLGVVTIVTAPRADSRVRRALSRVVARLGGAGGSAAAS